MWATLSALVTFVGVVHVLRATSFGNSALTIPIVALFNVPVLMLGNSASAGIFPADLVLLVFVFRFAHHLKSTLVRAWTKKWFLPFCLLVAYAVLRGVTAVAFGDYGYYDRFVVYGIFRWIFFFLVFLIFLTVGRHGSLLDTARRLALPLITFFLGAIVHQSGYVDLSAWRAIGVEAAYGTEYLAGDVYRAYLGNNAATVGCVSVFGILLGSLLFSSWPWTAGLLVVLASASLLGGGSRSDLLGLGVALLIWLIYSPTSKKKLKLAFWGSGILGITLVVTASLDVYGVERLLSTDVLGEARGAHEGTLAYRVHWWGVVWSYLAQNPGEMAIGYGPNAFRMMAVAGVTPINFGHNVYLHTLGELGWIGLAAFIVLSASTLKWLMTTTGEIGSEVELIAAMASFFLIQRLAAGFAVDSIFAVDNMLATNVLFALAVAGGLGFTRLYRGRLSPGSL